MIDTFLATASYGMAALGITACFFALATARAARHDRAAMIHWRNRAIDLSVEKTEAARIRSERARHARRCQIEQRKMG